ncbi:MAG: glycine betaine ABC transporter substrate-binding protein [Anaerovoracaceae bacterium]|jgi:glycine betaine/choline ABC-type transport system substrate-binding protein
MKMFKKKTMQKVVLFSLIAVMLLAAAGCGKQEAVDIRVGGKNYTEQFILAEILAQLIEENTDYSVSLLTNLADTVLFDAIKADQVDVYMEYTGTALIHLGQELMSDPGEVYELVKKEYEEKFDIHWLEPYGFNNTYAMVVRDELAEQYGLTTTTDLVPYAKNFVLGCSYAFTERHDGYPGLSKAYGLEFKDVRGMDSSLMYQAVDQESVEVVAGFTTDGRIPAFGLRVLEDDLNFFPPYNAATVIRGETLRAYPELEELLNGLAGRIDDARMAELNGWVDLDKLEPADAARRFLEEEGLI